MPTNPFLVPDIEAALSGRYKLGPELRVGGQGVVYRANRSLDLDGQSTADEVALKLHLDASQDERAAREISVMKTLNHKALATLLEDGVTAISGRLVRYIAWGFIEGIALDTRLAAGPLTEKATIQIGRDVTSALIALWSRRIVHRDVTPKNIILKPDGTAVLIDLGGARHLDNISITAPGSTFGTMGYFSPEQFRAERTLTAASDIFTLGVVLLQCLTGAHPTNLDQNLLVLSPPSVASIPSISKPLADIIDRMLQLRASFRPTLQDLLSAFDGLLS